MTEIRPHHLALLALVVAAGCDRNAGERPPAAGADEPAAATRTLPDPDFVGGERCAACHADEAERWRGSHHDLAMQRADAATVRGDFDDAELRHGEAVTRFYRRGDAFVVETDGPEGTPVELEVAYVFGVEPLEQYLVALPGGRLQALAVAWDTRPELDGGQRWFHLYAGEDIDHGDPLHWSGVYQRWNTSCADCHSTDLVKGFDAGTQSFETRFESVDVDCEACHGPGSRHAADPGVPPPASRPVPRAWVLAEGQSIAARVPGGTDRAEIEVCAQCHSRRAQLTDAHVPGDPLLDAYRPAWLEPGLYHADGQIQDEVYVYGSFLQSAMAQAGVTCTDCHDPHTAELRAEGNALCGQCHSPSTYDAPAHHRHMPATEAAQCTTCHMRAETYMIVDPRRDHSFRVPRPDLSAELGSPNACNDCHADESSEWAAARVAEWFPNGRSSEPHFGRALHAGRTWAADARTLLTALIEDTEAPAIVRATAIDLMAQRLTAADAAWVERRLDEDEPLLALAAVHAAEALEPARRAELLQRLLTADRLAVRIAAARALLPARSLLSERRRGDLDAALAEYLAAQAFNADRPEGLMSQAAVVAEGGRHAEAGALYREAIERYPWFGALYVNLADLERLSGRDAESLAVLRSGLERNPGDAALELALGFALVRAGERDEALERFAAAVAAAPDEPYYAYVLAIAENDAGRGAQALERLRATHERFPGHPDTLFALATMLRDAGDVDAAFTYAERLVALLPGDASALSLRAELEAQRP